MLLLVLLSLVFFFVLLNIIGLFSHLSLKTFLETDKNDHLQRRTTKKNCTI